MELLEGLDAREKRRFIIKLFTDIVFIVAFVYMSFQAKYWWQMGVHDALRGCPALLWGNRTIEEVESIILNGGINGTNMTNLTWRLDYERDIGRGNMP